MRKLNDNVERRDEILFGTAYSADRYRLGGACHFNRLGIDRLRTLVDEEFIDLDECQNYSPSTGDFLEFMTIHPEFTAHGYAISPDRDDYRVTIEGIESDREIEDYAVLEEFVDLCRFADEFCINPPYAWWD